MQIRTILADPPWPERGGGKSKRGADRHYPLMSVKDITALMRDQICEQWDVADDAHFWCWVTNNYLEAGLSVLKACGFRYVTNIVWTKPSMGIGQYTRGQHELCLFAVKGKPPYKNRGQYSTWLGQQALARPRIEGTNKPKHSAKPSNIFEMVEGISHPTYIEMFSRGEPYGPDWYVWGNEAKP